MSSHLPPSAPSRSAGTRDHERVARLNDDDARAWLRCARDGDFESAWQCSDRILERTRGPRDCAAPRHVQQVWDGTPLAGRRVLIRCYHGLGDTIQFIRYAPLVRAVAQDVAVWAQPDLLPLLDTVRGIDRTLPLHDGAPDVAYDVDVEVMELPWIFRTTLATIPHEVPYLHAAPLSLRSDGRPRVGIVWRAGDWDARRSIRFHAVAKLFECQDVVWFQLQDHLEPEEGHRNLCPLDTAGIPRLARCMRALDLVITIDSMPAHLAGALGVPVWTLLPSDADWRWMKERDDIPWYPTMRLFRQRHAGEWEPVLEQVRSALAAQFGG